MVEIPTLPDSIDNAAKNLTDKPTAAIGQTISELWQLVLGGRISLAAEKQRLRYAQDLEEYRKTLEQKVLSIPEGKQVEPTMQISAQALVDSQYCVDTKEIRELFANLIARSMHADYSGRVHPSFSKIAQQLTPLEAQMLRLLYYRHNGNGIAIVNYIRRDPPKNGYTLLLERIPTDVPDGYTPEAAARSLVLLTRMGLVDIPADAHFTDTDRYAIFEQTPIYKRFSDLALKYGFQLDMQKCIARLTVLGRDFVSVCLD